MNYRGIFFPLFLSIPFVAGFVAGRAHADQPHMASALNHLRNARGELQLAAADKGGHRERAISIIDSAITEVQTGIEYALGQQDLGFTIVRVPYGTNRTRIPAKGTAYDYDARPTALSFGTATVSIPKDHRIGYWEKPLLEAFANQESDVILLTVTPQSTSEFTTGIRDRVARSRKKEAFVFIHGYQTTFQEAIQRTALLAYDLKFDGAPITFAWPSRAAYESYPADEEAAQASVEDLEAFLQLVAKESGATRIHLIAHSMGNRILLQALRALQQRHQQPTNLANLVLAAPDVNVTYFQQLMNNLKDIPQRVTLYASSNDKALTASRAFHDYARAGEAGKGVFVLNGMDSIDVSAVDTSLSGHSYYGDNRSVITDLYELILKDDPPAERLCLSPRHRANLPYWVFDRCR